MTAAGYAKPAPFLVAPGQLMTFFFRGIAPLPDGSPRSANAQTTPLPDVLAGLSLTLSQPGQEGPLHVPLVSVRQDKECDAATPACYLTSIRLQVPYEIAASTPGSSGVNAPDAQAVITVDGQASRSFTIRPVSANGHVLTSCDISGETNPDAVCERVAYHNDGRPVNASAPASKGESIVIFAFGLGRTTPPAETGKSAAAGAVIDPDQLIVTLKDNFANAVSSLPRRFDSDPYNSPRAKTGFAGLAPGQIGLYQINVPIPSSFDTTLVCTTGGPQPLIHSNGILEVTTPQGTENVPICVGG